MKYIKSALVEFMGFFFFGGFPIFMGLTAAPWMFGQEGFFWWKVAGSVGFFVASITCLALYKWHEDKF